jgi:hypothetical protein
MRFLQVTASYALGMSLRGAQRRSNPRGSGLGDCFASLAMTDGQSAAELMIQPVEAGMGVHI